VPANIANYLTPLALAIWVMDDGACVGKSLKLCTNSFTYADCNRLTNVLYDLYHIKATVQSAGVINQYHIYI
jgi:ubiquinol-cytochrome c reductase cytochrome b subunit